MSQNARDPGQSVPVGPRFEKNPARRRHRTTLLPKASRPGRARKPPVRVRTKAGSLSSSRSVVSGTSPPSRSQTQVRRSSCHRQGARAASSAMAALWVDFSLCRGDRCCRNHGRLAQGKPPRRSTDAVEQVTTDYLKAISTEDSPTIKKLGTVEEPPAIRSFRNATRDPAAGRRRGTRRDRHDRDQYGDRACGAEPRRPADQPARPVARRRTAADVRSRLRRRRRRLGARHAAGAGKRRRACAVLTVDLCSLCMRVNDPSPSMFVSTSLFGDGAAGVLLRNTRRSRHGAGDGAKGAGPRILAVGEWCWRGTEHIMGWDIKDDGFGIVLSPELPALMSAELKPAVENFLDRNGFRLPTSTDFCSIPAAGGFLKPRSRCSGLRPNSSNIPGRCCAATATCRRPRSCSCSNAP